MVKLETGFLHAPTRGFEIISTFSYPESLLDLPASSITAISGKIVTTKDPVDSFNQVDPSLLSYYSFSTQTYPVIGTDAYIVTLASEEDSPTTPSVSVKTSKAKLIEGPKKSSSSFIITLNQTATTDVTIRFKISGTAKIGKDYRISNKSGSLRVAKGKKNARITITTLNDNKKERKEKVVCTILPHSSYTLGKRKSAAVTIIDDD